MPDLRQDQKNRRGRLHGKRAIVRLALPLAALLALLGGAAERDHSEGMKDMTNGNREAGLTLLAKASQAEPSNSQYRLDFLQQQALTERDALTRGDEAR